MANKKIFILGVNGFIGSSLAWKILKKTDWEIVGMDLGMNKIENCLKNERFGFFKKNILTDKDWIEEQIKACDVVIPLVAIATPTLYVKDPLRVYELDNESNGDLVKKSAKVDQRIIFPTKISTNTTRPSFSAPCRKNAGFTRASNRCSTA